MHWRPLGSSISVALNSCLLDRRLKIVYSVCLCVCVCVRSPHVPLANAETYIRNGSPVGRRLSFARLSSLALLMPHNHSSAVSHGSTTCSTSHNVCALPAYARVPSRYIIQPHVECKSFSQAWRVNAFSPLWSSLLPSSIVVGSGDARAMQTIVGCLNFSPKRKFFIYTRMYIYYICNLCSCPV